MQKLWPLIAMLVLWTVSGLWASATLEGIIETAEEDEKYNPIQVNLMVDKEVKGTIKTYYYRINLEKGKGKELLNLTEKKVRVTSNIWTDNRGRKRITVMDYALLPEKEKQSFEEALSFPPEEQPVLEAENNLDYLSGEQ
jgi:hypothetical protein